MKAYLKNLRIAPRKVRLVADLVRGLPVGAALAALQNTPKAASRPLAALIQSAVANARFKDENLDPTSLRIGKLTVDKGLVIKRYLPRAHGRATPLHKISSHVSVELTPIT